MRNLWKTAGLFASALLIAGGSAWAQNGPPLPGAVNYTEGQVFLNGQALTASQTAKVAPGQILETRDGKAEMLLTPGMFLRLNSNSQVRLDSNSITDTRVVVLRGEAMVEADQVVKDNGVQILDGNYSARIEKPGIYEFNADQPMVRTYDGEMTVSGDDRSANVKKGHELDLSAQNAKLKTHGFDTHMTDSLYAWSRVRSEYMAEANMATAQTIVVDNPGWYYGTGWYWNPYWSSWAFVPGAGLWGSPFGFGLGFYSPVAWSYYRPYIGGLYGGYYRGYPGYRGVAPAAGFRGGAPAFRGGAAAPAFRGGVATPHFGGGGFAGGMHFGGGGHFGGGRR
jgi:hypothetical protein